MMKSLKLIGMVIIAAVLSVSFTGCLFSEMGEPGPQGPVGEQGPQGLPGPQGPKGESKPSDTVFYSKWESYIGTQKGSRDYVATINVPQLTEDILDSVMVIVFYNAQTSGYAYIYKLPYTSATGGGQFIYFSVEPQKIVLHATYNYFTATRRFRYVIIPLTDEINIARKSSVEGEADSAWYAELCEKYNIPQ